MIRNYFKIAFRHLSRSTGYSAINVGGLAVGMAVAMLIALWIYDELSFNKYHKNYDRIAQVMRHSTYEGKIETGGQSNPFPLGPELQALYGGYFSHIVMATHTVNNIISNDDKSFNQSGRFMQPGAPELLSLAMINGHGEGLKEPNSILLSSTLSKKLFGQSDPINKIIKIGDKMNAKVTGVYEDLPNSSVFNDLTYIAPFDLYELNNKWVQNVKDNWSENSFPVYVQIAPGTDFEEVSSKIKDIFLPHLDDERAKSKPEVFLHPMSKWHLYSTFENGLSIKSERLNFVWFYGIIGSFVLFLACINFMNLSTARSEKRAKEVGIRKAIGSMRRQLVGQFFGEALLTASLAFLVSIALVQLTLPRFNKVADKEIVILWTQPLFWLAGIAFIFITGILAGSYPALYLSSFDPVKALKGTFRAGNLVATPRKVLVVLQFTTSIALIIGTIIVYQQIQFAKNRPVGYSRNGLLVFQMTSPDTRNKYDILREELKRSGAVSEVAASASNVTNIWSQNSGFDWKGKDPDLKASFGTLSVTHEYGETIGWEFVAGRGFSRDFSSDSTGFVINESAAKLMGLENPVGETITWNRYTDRSFQVLGVVKDMVMESPFDPPYPTVFFMDNRKNWLFVKINPSSSVSDALVKIKNVFQQVVPTAPFDYKFVEEEYAHKFSSEERIGKLARFFAVLAIFISCLGLFGLASFVAEQRTKEIGIRKVVGASVFSLWGLLSKDFIGLVFVSCVIAMPIAYYYMNGWLQKYQYRTAIEWWIFAVSVAGALLITLFTVSFQAIKAALANPVKSLRTE